VGPSSARTDEGPGGHGDKPRARSCSGGLLFRTVSVSPRVSSGVPSPRGAAANPARYPVVMRRFLVQEVQKFQDHLLLPTSKEGMMLTAAMFSCLPLGSCGGVFVSLEALQRGCLRVALCGPPETLFANGLFFVDLWVPGSFPASPALMQQVLLSSDHGHHLVPRVTKVQGDHRAEPGQALVALLASLPGALFVENSGGEARDVMEATLRSGILAVVQGVGVPQEFTALAWCHFRLRGRDILEQCKLWAEAAPEACREVSACVNGLPQQ